MVTVTVPATSANVGAGFDSLGLAVSMHNVFTFEESDRIQISSVDGTHVPAGSNNWSTARPGSSMTSWVSR